MAKKQSPDYLGDYIKNNEPEQNIVENMNNIEVIGDNIRQKVDYIETTLESQLQNIDITILPYHKFYPIGTKISIRSAKTKEIEAFSVVNEENQYDVHVKINDMLKACVTIKYIDGSYGSYKDIQYGDRDILIILISRLTSKSGRKIAKSIKCSCGHENVLDFIPANFIYKKENEKVKKYFDVDERLYKFKLKNGVSINIKPPTIGLTESLNAYIIYNTLKSQQENADNIITYVPNISFMDIITYIKSGDGISELEIKEWEQEEFEFERMNDELFMFCQDAIKLITFGIEKVKAECTSKTCNNEVSTPLHYPDGIRALFIVPNAFDEFIE